MDLDNVRTHYSHQAKDQLIDLYLAKIDVMKNHIQFLEMQIENFNKQLNNIQ
jgi:hypothetical protein